MKIGHFEFDFENQSYVMGILNVTPDSFSDGGRYSDKDRALKRAEEMMQEGAALIDVGGESTRPGHTEISAGEEMDRVLPVVEAIKKNLDIPLSLDTWKADVARAGLAAGVDMINDVCGLRRDQGQMAEVIAGAGIPCCLMHSRGQAHPSEGKEYLKVFSGEIEEILVTAGAHNISKDRIILDPGIGFGKTFRQNLLLLRHLEQMKRWGLPVLLGTSNKSMIGQALDLPVSERGNGTLATTVMGRMAGASIFRVHDVKANRQALLMAEAILHAS